MVCERLFISKYLPFICFRYVIKSISFIWRRVLWRINDVSTVFYSPIYYYFLYKNSHVWSANRTSFVSQRALCRTKVAETNLLRDNMDPPTSPHGTSLSRQTTSSTTIFDAHFKKWIIYSHCDEIRSFLMSV